MKRDTIKNLIDKAPPNSKQKDHLEDMLTRTKTTGFDFVVADHFWHPTEDVRKTVGSMSWYIRPTISPDDDTRVLELSYQSTMLAKAIIKNSSFDYIQEWDCSPPSSSEEKQDAPRDIKAEILKEIINKELPDSLVIDEDTMKRIESLYEQNESVSLTKLKSKFNTTKENKKITLGRDQKGITKWVVNFVKYRKKAGKYLAIEWTMESGRWQFVLSYHDSRKLIHIATAEPQLDFLNDSVLKDEFKAIEFSEQEHKILAKYLQPDPLTWKFYKMFFHSKKKGRFGKRRRLITRLSEAGCLMPMPKHSSEDADS